MIGNLLKIPGAISAITKQSLNIKIIGNIIRKIFPVVDLDATVMTLDPEQIMESAKNFLKTKDNIIDLTYSDQKAASGNTKLARLNYPLDPIN